MPADFLTTLFEHKAWCDRGLVAALRAAPAEADRRQMAVVLFTLDHAARVDRIFRARLEGAAPDMSAVVADRMPDLGTLATTLEETDAWYLDYVSRATPGELGEVVDFTYVADGEAGRLTRGEMLAHVITHGASHRGAIGKMLETMGVPGASDMVTTFRRSTPAPP